MQTTFMTARYLVIALVFITSATFVQAEAVSGHVKSVLGEATLITSAGHTRPIEIGTTVASGSRIQTAADGRVVIEWMPGAYSVITPNSDIEVSSLGYSQTAMGTPHRKISLKLVAGNIFCHLKHDAGVSNFSVGTPEGVAAARGTDWVVQRNGNTTKVATFTSAIAFTMPNGKVFGVKAGIAYSVGATYATPLTQDQVEDFADELQDAGLSVIKFGHGGYTVTYRPPDGTPGFSFTINPGVDETDHQHHDGRDDSDHGGLGELPIPSTNFTSP